jgi:hypothetical protein
MSTRLLIPPTIRAPSPIVQADWAPGAFAPKQAHVGDNLPPGPHRQASEATKRSQDWVNVLEQVTGV